MSNRMRATKSKTGMRRSHHALKEPTTTVDSDGVRHFKHRASLKTGKYRGRQVIDVESKIAKKQAKREKRGLEDDSDQQE